jgi:HlyD family secretion protein
VLAIAPSAQQVDGVVSFYTTISLLDGPDRLRNGMTALAAVRTEVRENVLRVPDAAVGRTGGRPSVTVPGPGGQPQQVPFDAGLVGDAFTEVRSGLSAGQQIWLPQARVSAVPNRRGPGN